jgi:hypothetical protein
MMSRISRSRVRARLALASLVVWAAAGIACSSTTEHPPPAQAGVTGGNGGGGSDLANDASAGSDGGTDATLVDANSTLTDGAFSTE